MIKNLPAEVTKFVRYVKADCKKHGIKFIFSPKRFVTINVTKCNGYFDTEKKELAVAGGQPLQKWLRILTHEYGHMTQWKDNTRIWNACKENGYDCEQMLEAWVDRACELTKDQLQDYTTKARNLEWECEKRTIRLIKRYNLPLDTRAYAKTANAYVYFWTYQQLRRHWYVIGNEPYNNSQIVAAMPETLNLNYVQMPQHLVRLYRKELGF